MRLLRALALAILVTCGLTFVAAPAGAYPPDPTTVTTDKTVYDPGDSVTITAMGFTACVGATVTFTITPPTGPAIVLTAVIGANGTATVVLPPPLTSGSYAVTASAPGCAPASTTFSVTGTPPTTLAPTTIPTSSSGPSTTIPSNAVDPDQHVYPPGSPSTLTAQGFGACVGKAITFTVQGPSGAPIVATSIVGPDGTASVTVTLPNTIGVYTVTASSGGCDDAVNSLTVQQLPVTGTDTGAWLRVAGVAVAAGVGLLLVAWRRRHRRPVTG